MVSRMSGSIALGAAMLLIVIAGSCSGGLQSNVQTLQASSTLSVQAPAAADQLAELPAPSELLRKSSGVGLKRGAAWFESVVSANTVDDAGLSFTPDFPTDGTGEFSGLAWAMFELGLEGYTDNITLTTGWSDLPAVAGNTYAAFADFTLDRWHWYPVNAAGQVETGENSDFISQAVDAEGMAVIVIARTGSDPNKLYWLRVGENLPPTIVGNEDLQYTGHHQHFGAA